MSAESLIRTAAYLKELEEDNRALSGAVQNRIAERDKAEEEARYLTERVEKLERQLQSYRNAKPENKQVSALEVKVREHINEARVALDEAEMYIDDYVDTWKQINSETKRQLREKGHVV